MKKATTKKLVVLLDTGKRNQTTFMVLDNKDRRREQVRRTVRRWRKNNPEKHKEHLEYVKQWKQQNKDKVKEYNHNYYQENKERYDKYYSRPAVKQRIVHNQREYRNRKKQSKKK